MLKKDRAIHSWYQFVLGYPPHLVRYYLLKFKIKPKNICFDPFAGTGTTPVECMKNGIESYGIEANTITYFASKVKTNMNLDPNDLEDVLGFIYSSAILSFKKHNITDEINNLYLPAKIKNPIIIPKIPQMDDDQQKIIPKGFISEKPLNKVLILKEIIESLEEETIKEFYILSLANLIVNKAGNVGFGPEVYRTKPKIDVNVLDYFLTNSQMMIEDIKGFSRKDVKTTIINGDSRKIDECLAPALKGKIKCVITSPPYPNEKDYTRTTRLESVLLGFIRDRKDLRNLKEHLLRSNSRNIFVKDNDGDYAAKFTRINEIAKEIEDTRIELNKTSGFEKLYHKIVTHYFGGMYLHLNSLKPYLEENAKLAYVVGDQMSFFQTYIPTAELLADIARDLGYDVTEIELWRSRLATRTKQQINENVLILENRVS